MSSNSIYSSFKPTYLYIKRHSITGKLYFGKTVRDPEKYFGSGLHWKRHIKHHGIEHVETLWYCLFLDEESITEFALNFSRQNNIVESDEWLNMMEENGIGGGCSESRRTRMKGIKLSESTKERISESSRGMQRSEETKRRISEATSGSNNPMYGSSGGMYGKRHNEEAKLKMSETRKGMPLITCPHCGKLGDVSNMKRWHFDNCKMLSAP